MPTLQPVRASVSRTHGITLLVLAAAVAVGAVEAIRSDADQWLKLGNVLAVMLIIAFFGYAWVSTVLVAVLAKRPVHVIGVHLAALGSLALVLFETCWRA